tara:strand:- start:426 stop:887 length:462 start_codon:yes stop_codon:yes gene_type:complete
LFFFLVKFILLKVTYDANSEFVCEEAAFLESTFLCVEDKAGAEYFISFFVIHEETPEVIFLAVLKEFLVLHFRSFRFGDLFARLTQINLVYLLGSFTFSFSLYIHYIINQGQSQAKTGVFRVTLVTLKKRNGLFSKGSDRGEGLNTSPLLMLN